MSDILVRRDHPRVWPGPVHRLLARLAARTRPADPQGDDVLAMRRRLDSQTRLPPAPRVVQYRDEIAGVPGRWLRPRTTSTHTDRAAVLYLHGGAYTAGGSHTHQLGVSDLVRRTRVPFFLADYRRAPEHPHPAAVDDASAVLMSLAERYGPGHLAVAGDSAGGGLAVATLCRHVATGGPLPVAAALLAPWVDLTLAWAETATDGSHDVLLTASGLRVSAEAYGATSGVEHPEVSPLGAPLAGMPPTLVQIGTWDLLLDEGVELARRMVDAGVDVELDTWQGMQHVFQMFWPVLPEARRANRIVAAFLRGHLGVERPRPQSPEPGLQS